MRYTVVGLDATDWVRLATHVLDVPASAMHMALHETAFVIESLTAMHIMICIALDQPCMHAAWAVAPGTGVAYCQRCGMSLYDSIN